MFVRNAWYAAGWIGDFGRGCVEARQLLGEPVVFYRGESGQLVALEDRCSHRLAPLSYGRIEGNDLRCQYHGLRFAPDGRCVEVPGQPQVPPSLAVRRYPVAERHGVAWIWMGDAAQADESLVPPFVGPDSTEFEMLPGRMDYDAHYQLINDNLLDLSHVSYVHAESFGAGPAFAETRPQITRLPRGLRVQRWLRNNGVPKYMQGKMPADARFDVFMTYDFLVPGVFLMRTDVFAVGMADQYGGKEPEGGEPLHREFTCQAVTPLTDRTTCYLFASGAWARLPGLAEFYRDVAYQAFAEDKRMIEAQQRVIDADPTRKMQATSFDAAPSQYRWLVDKLMAAEQPTPATA